MNLEDFESIVGFTFHNKSLLTRALTHRSYLNENPDLPYLDNERLEFLGDAILDFVAAEYLYQHFPEMSEGDLTSLRAALVKGESLARFAVDQGMPPYLLMSRGEDAAGGRTRALLRRMRPRRQLRYRRPGRPSRENTHGSDVGHLRSVRGSFFTSFPSFPEAFTAYLSLALRAGTSACPRLDRAAQKITPFARQTHGGAP